MEAINQKSSMQMTLHNYAENQHTSKLVKILILQGSNCNYLILCEYCFNSLYCNFDRLHACKRFIVKCAFGSALLFIKYTCLWSLWIPLCLKSLITSVLVSENGWSFVLEACGVQSMILLVKWHKSDIETLDKTLALSRFTVTDDPKHYWETGNFFLILFPLRCQMMLRRPLGP